MTRAAPPIVITRAAPGASETQVRLEAMGLTSIAAPMLQLHKRPAPDLPKTEAISGLVFTSANGVRTYQEIRTDRALPAWCVGPATAQAAHDAGFVDIRESAGNAEDLAAFITAHSRPTNTPLLHIANAAAAGNLKRLLTANGYKVAFAPLYEMRAATRLPDDLKSLMIGNAAAIILIHSAKGADALAGLISEAAPKAWSYIAISEKAFAPLHNIEARNVAFADAPNEDGLMRALQAALATLSA